MLSALIWVVLNRGLTPDPAMYLRCSQCGTISGETSKPYRLISTTRLSQSRGHEGTLTEWRCPECGKLGPIGSDEILPCNALMRCRRTFLCRYEWSVPASVTKVTCPRCGTRQQTR